MFGIVQGGRYGWPKNVLQWAGIYEIILDICATVWPHFVIADAIVAMEGDAAQRRAKHLKTVSLSDYPMPADASLAAALGLDPIQMVQIREAGRFLGNVSDEKLCIVR